MRPSVRDESSHERTRDLLDNWQWISGQTDEVNENDVVGYRRTTDPSSTEMDWLNSELYELLAIKTSDTAMASVKSLEEFEVKGIVGWQRLEREARGYHRHRVAPSQRISDASRKSAESH